MDKIYKVALIGCGSISKNHLAALKALDFVKVVALCDVKIDKAEARKAEFDLDSRIYEDYHELLKHEELDAVHIATPHFLHAEMAIAALERNINVYLEKPIAISISETEKILAAESKSNARITVSFQTRFNPATIEAMKIAEADGGAISGYGSVFWERGEKYYTESGWRGSMTTEGGGVMINQAIHTLDLLCFFLGKPQKVCATTANHHLKGVIDVEDSCEGVILFEHGKQANFYATTAFKGYNATSLFLLTKNHKIEIRDSKLYVDGQHRKEGNDHENFVSKACYGNGHFTMIAKFYEALDNGGEMPVTAESASYALKILLAAYRSDDEFITL